jgi:capsular polysaccharide transport system permease protein
MIALAFKQMGPSAPRLPAIFGWVRGRSPSGGQDLDKAPRQPLFASAASRFAAITFLVMVMLPTAVSAIYLGLFASDEYIANVQFSVRSSTDKGSSSVPDGLIPENLRSMAERFMGSSGGQAATDAYVIANYVQSPAAVADLDRDGRLRRIFGSDFIDRFSRFDTSGSAERLFSYWKSKVNISVDRLSRLITLRVSAFKPDDAVELAHDIVRRSEDVVNTMVDRRRRDTVRNAQSDLDQAEQRYMQALVAIEEFRATDTTPDHARAIENTMKMLTEFEMEQIGLKAQRSGLLRQLSQGASSLQPLQARINALEGQIGSLRDQLASTRAQARNAASSITRLETLEVERHFAQRIYEMAQSVLLKAKEQAARQSEFLVVFVEPRTAGRQEIWAVYKTVGLIFLLGLFTWALGALVSASVANSRL